MGGLLGSLLALPSFPVYGPSTPAWQELWEIDNEREVVARAMGALDGRE